MLPISRLIWIRRWLKKGLPVSGAGSLAAHGRIGDVGRWTSTDNFGIELYGALLPSDPLRAVGMGLVLNLQWRTRAGVEGTLVRIDIDPNLIRRFREDCLPLHRFRSRIL